MILHLAAPRHRASTPDEDAMRRDLDILDAAKTQDKPLNIGRHCGGNCCLRTVITGTVLAVAQ